VFESTSAGLVQAALQVFIASKHMHTPALRLAFAYLCRLPITLFILHADLGFVSCADGRTESQNTHQIRIRYIYSLIPFNYSCENSLWPVPRCIQRAGL